ncbi:MAG: 5'/3'-nucleotidase SurE [Gammaproteobacteria bacterium TMED78]|nr:MAG: 5'/3'-nucleotidase SurE [Gammaproteobacteria bacterium TMED78]|tara:strand:- start:97538 stop:98287 length:750 start_codon:yes stop_codon:yes gene_type:complete
MKILLSNDDGYQSRGLRLLAKSLKEVAEILVIAPDRNCSGGSSALTLSAPLNIQRFKKDYYYVNGTPTDCIHLALTSFFDFKPDMIISGINHGANLGDDVLYSGTVAAALEARLFGIPSIAISLAYKDGSNFETAVSVTKDLIKMIEDNPLKKNTILNVNVPDIPKKYLKGISSTRLGSRERPDPAIATKNPKGKPFYWIGKAGLSKDDGEGTDFFSVKNNIVSVSPLKVDLTDYDLVPKLNNILTSLK